MPETPPAAETGPEAGRRRLWRAFVRPQRRQLVVGVLLAVVGFAAVTQFRTTEADNSYAGLREQDLIDVLSGLTGATQRTQAELSRLQDTRDQLQTDTQKRQAALTEASTQVDNLKIIAGLVPVTGPGIRVRIEEKTAEINVDSFIDLIQELRTVGAEAMQLNGQVRLVAQTSFEQANGGLLVDGEMLEPPYTLDVIGEPGALEGAVTFLRGPQEELESDGATVVVSRMTSLDITAVAAAD
ncbi:DUF881 domain-containing protein [Nocardioides sp.]|uniref:DUF881 domain-containing protein n=1 Tax=Nocardioides sp. TaxID=35761 RepID=UPI0039E35716